MKIFRIAQEIDPSSLFIDRRDEGDRIRFVLCVADEDELEDIEYFELSDKRSVDGILIKKEVGRLVVQFNLSDKYHILSAFWIDEEYRGIGWGKKMMLMALKDPKVTQKLLIVSPQPYSDDAKNQIPEITEMYKYFGFKPFKDKYLAFSR